MERSVACDLASDAFDVRRVASSRVLSMARREGGGVEDGHYTTATSTINASGTTTSTSSTDDKSDKNNEKLNEPRTRRAERFLSHASRPPHS